jgi:N-acetylglucosaminyldiphosphoundecaprenol N-acetyl-beta-D-mannosaminyltransferase
MSLLGLRVNALSDQDVVRIIANAIDENKRCFLANHNAHSLYLWSREPSLRKCHAVAEYVLIDGMSLILLGRMLGLPLKRQHRATSLDFMPLLLPEAVENRWRIYYLGSRPGVAEKGAMDLCQKYSGLQIRARHGYFNIDKSSRENREVLDDIAAFSPHVLLVGMGMPRQEKWIVENREEIAANVISPCGAHMDYVAGEIPTAPRWLARMYLEWLYRLIAEPGRLWRRYLVEPLFIVASLVLNRFKRPYPALEDEALDIDR